MKSNSQGKDTNTVLTNLSKYVTVVSSEPYCHRKLHRYGLPSLRKSSTEGRKNVRGSRPLHQTTLTFETSPLDRTFMSTMKESFSGRYDLLPCKQPTRCPSLHTSQFKVGINSKLDFKTTSRDSFTDHSKHALVAHVDRERWKKQMAGNDMMNNTRHEGSKDIDFVTTYSKTHQQLLSFEREKCNYGQWKTSIYNIVNGHPQSERQKKLNSERKSDFAEHKKEPLILC